MIAAAWHTNNAILRDGIYAERVQLGFNMILNRQLVYSTRLGLFSYYKICITHAPTDITAAYPSVRSI